MLAPYLDSILIEAGLDEAGRGCYAGPVSAAAVILKKDFYHPLLRDSKKLKAEDRYLLRTVIEEESIAFAVALVDNDEIDLINILQASFKAMHLALDRLPVVPEQLLVDGNRFKPYKNIPAHCIVKGDDTYAPIAAASILAKTYRDDYMKEVHKEYPHYRWSENKGYGTPAHRRAISEYGLCKYHRKSFQILF